MALDLFSSRSYAEVSIDEIAAAAGVSKGLLYHYFSGKRELFVGVVQVACEQLVAATEPDPSLTPDDQLRQTIDGYLDWVAAHSVGYRTLLRGGLAADEDLLAVVEGYRSTVAQRIISGLNELVPSGTVEVGPAVNVAVRGWIGFVESATLEWLDARQRPARGHLREMFADLLRHALAAAATTPGRSAS